MSYEKLTYSGTECNNHLYFSFDAEYFDKEKISQELGIEPNSVMINKEPVPKSTSWEFRIDARNDINLVSYLKRLIDIFEPKTEIIIGLNKRTIKFLAKTGTEVDFDLYKADAIGLLKN